jgi:hypothetical protein
VRNGKRLVTDEPFAETRERFGGCYLSDAGDLDEAIGIAAGVPVALMGTIEIRPVLEIRVMPPDTQRNAHPESRTRING